MEFQVYRIIAYIKYGAIKNKLKIPINKKFSGHLKNKKNIIFQI